MVSSMSSLVIVTVIIVSMSQTMVMVKADETLIGALCDKTPYPGICRDCLHGDSGSPRADIAGLAKISLNCLVRSSKLFSDDMENKWNVFNGNAVEKDVLYWCWLGGKSANNLFQEALSLMDNWTQYGTVKDKIQSGNANAKWCLDRYKSKLPGTPVPDLITTETAVVDQDAVNADRLLKSLIEGN